MKTCFCLKQRRQAAPGTTSELLDERQRVWTPPANLNAPVDQVKALDLGFCGFGKSSEFSTQMGSCFLSNTIWLKITSVAYTFVVCGS